MTYVVLRASGYTWKCPECDRENVRRCGVGIDIYQR